MIKTTFSKENQNGWIEADKRSKHRNQKCVDQQRGNPVISNIKSFKVLASHYVWKTTTSQFVPSEMSIKEMHQPYVEYCNSNNYEVLSYDFYIRVFDRRFWRKCQKPKKMNAITIQVTKTCKF